MTQKAYESALFIVSHYNRLGGFPIEMETQISWLITCSIAILILIGNPPNDFKICAHFRIGKTAGLFSIFVREFKRVKGQLKINLPDF